ncbi:hypothetical protein KIN20_021890 [Parelaphostrongylus tenuis]|uniref:Abnormal cell migration protein 18-like fibronectin type I domain-containing protein n=1 Tax=Parelaphostrongylus tenuis TaxID=148309 RepID=A0AAD5QUU0_PARTN|nr:hypothetical protein KIN20_021890 [Parelaphostrongylus tenuis]
MNDTQEGGGSQTTIQCEDDKGIIRDQGSEWQEEWKQFRCGDNGAEPMGCVAPPSTRIPIGETRMVGDSTVACKKDSNGSLTMQCTDNNSGRGSTWIKQRHHFKCSDNGVVVTGCYTSTGTFIRNGDVMTVNGRELGCETIAPNESRIKCKDNEGRDRDQGSEWKEGYHQLGCGDNGVETIGCVVPSSTTIQNGETMMVNGSTVRCKKEDNEVTMHCDVNNGGGDLQWRDESRGYSCGPDGTVVTDCYTTSGIKIAIGEKKLVLRLLILNLMLTCAEQVDGYPIACKEDKNDSATMPCEDSKGREREQGSEWQEGHRLVKCTLDGVKIIGCVTPSGMQIPKGESRLVDGLIITCEPDGKSGAQMKCQDSYSAAGLVWEEDSLRLGCKESGEVVYGCYTASAIYIPVGEVKSVNGHNLACKKGDNGKAILQCQDSEGRERSQGKLRIVFTTILMSLSEQEPEQLLLYLTFKCEINSTSL